MKTQAVTIVNQNTPAYLDRLGAAANHAAAQSVLKDYQARKSAETIRRQAADIALFALYLAIPKVTSPLIAQQIAETSNMRKIWMLLDQDGVTVADDMASELELWAGITWGLIEAFNRWSLLQGYSIGSVNVRLATLKSYAELAVKSGHLDRQEFTLIKTVKGYRASEGRNVDEKREQTRRPDAKKAEPTSISLEQARKLKQQPATKKGRRDALLMCLLLDLGLRVGEISDLNVSSMDLQAGTLTFYRHKVHKTQILNLERDVLLAARAYLAEYNQEQDKPLFAGPCSGERMSERTINARIATLGRKIGIEGLSPHDLRHYWATNAVRTGTDIKSLQDAGGWSSAAMPLRYAESSKIANSGVKLTV